MHNAEDIATAALAVSIFHALDLKKVGKGWFAAAGIDLRVCHTERNGQKAVAACSMPINDGPRTQQDVYR